VAGLYSNDPDFARFSGLRWAKSVQVSQRAILSAMTSLRGAEGDEAISIGEASVPAASSTRRLFLAASWMLLLLATDAAAATKRHRVGYISAASRSGSGSVHFEAFRQGLRELGYGDDDIEIEVRFADGHFERLPDFAAELVQLAPGVIVAASPQVVAALKQRTSTIPIVMTSAGDPVGLGFVANLAHPGGNITGLSTQSQDMAGKWVEMVKIAAPGAKRIAFLVNSTNPAHAVVLQGAQQAAQSLAVELLPIDARTPDELDGAFAAMVGKHVDALIGWGDPVFISAKDRIVEFAASQKLPAVYQFHDFVAVGGLMSFGPDLNDLYRRAAAYVDKILKGAKPADLPVEQPTKFQLAINLKTAEALGLTIPPLLLSRADEVIE
jgi:putative tryptophan/tyrosine transport system substrate-binding protein